MIEMMKESATIEEAICKIVRKCEFVEKIFKTLPFDENRSEFIHRLLRNYSLATGTYSLPFRMQNIESIISLVKNSQQHYLLDLLIMHIYPQVLTNDDFRNDFLSHSLFNELDWLGPLLVITDYFHYY